jgi:uncharacterized damage-inducible protein DinB
MTSPATPAPNASPVSPDEKRSFLQAYDREHATTMKVLRAFPGDRADLRPAPKCNTARDLAWTFVLERRLGTTILEDGMAARMSAPGGGKPPKAPESWSDLLAALDEAHRQFGDLVRSTPESELGKTSKFFVAPKTMGDVQRMGFLWFLLNDQIHHRGQLSVYLRMADGKVPSIYGPTADEPWT